MRINSLLRILAISAIFALVFGQAFAQEEQKKDNRFPADEFGVGAVMSFVNLNSPMMGGQVSYAFDESIHVGTQVSFAYESKSDVDKSDAATYFYFAPYVKYFLEPIRSFKPFAKASFVISSVPFRQFKQASGRNEVITESNTNIAIDLGGEWFPYKSVGVFGSFQFFEYRLDRSSFLVGLGPTAIGVEWFL